MANGSIKNTQGKQNFIYRAYTSQDDSTATTYLPPSQFSIGIDNGTPNVANTSLDNPVPISDGTTCDDGSNTFTGSSGGDNSTDNTTTYKEGAGNSDNTAQNLIANDTSAYKYWTINDLSSAGIVCDEDKYIGLWLYIKDATAYAKFRTAAYAVMVEIGSDLATDDYTHIWTASDLAVGWNWLSDGKLLSTWTKTGTPGTLSKFKITIVTNNATDTFVAGDVVYDLLRQWESSDLYQDFVSGYPSVDTTNIEATTRGYLTSLQANGFDLNGYANFNKDSTARMLDENTFTSISKEATDEIIFITVDEVI